MDEWIYDDITNAPRDMKPIVDKEMLWVNDQNNGAYNGQITFDTAVLSNSGRWMNYSEAYLQIPFVISAVGSVDMTATFNPWMAGLKCGHHQLIHSLAVEYNNTNVVQQQPYLNHFVSYKLMTSFSTNDLQKYGDLIGFWPDTADTFEYSAAAGANGIGFTNNAVIIPFYYSDVNFYENYLSPNGNDGMKKRLRSTGFIPGTTFPSSATLNTVSRANASGKSHFSDNGGAGAARIYYWVILATIRLKDLSDFFAKLPPVRGAFFRMIINYNSASFVVTSTGAVDNPHTLTTSIPNMLSGATNPLLVSSGLVQAADAAVPELQINNPFNVAAGTVTFQSGVIRTSQISPSLPISTCRLYCPGYQLNPIQERQVLETNRLRKVQYYDLYNFNLQGGNSIGSGSTFNSLITNGIVNPQFIVIIPQITAASNGLANLYPYQSPFDTSPHTTMPLASIINFNIQVSGTNVFQQNFNYDFEEFQNELAHLNALNGGLTTGLTSGLVGFNEFQYGYRYYAVDLKRRMPSEDASPKSILVTGQNNTEKSMDLICFIGYQREITIDLQTGELVSGSP